MVRTFLKKILALLGYQCFRLPKTVQTSSPHGWHPDHLRRLLLAPRTLVDVGVADGTPSLYQAFPDARLVMVEPLREWEPAMQRIKADRPQSEYHLCALGDQQGTCHISLVPGFLSKSSLCDPNHGGPLDARTSASSPKEEIRQIPLTTLDTLLDQGSFSPPFGLKIDTEGNELSVIRGAKRFLAETEWIIVETSLTPRIHGGYSFYDFISEMNRHGFRLCDLLTSSGRNKDTGELEWMDAVFKRHHT